MIQFTPENLKNINRLEGMGKEAKALKGIIIKTNDIHAKDIDGRTALHHAAISGDVAMARELMKMGTSVGAQDKDGATPLIAAVKNDNENIVKLFLDPTSNVPDKAILKSDSEKMNALHWAAFTNRLNIVKILTKDKRFSEEERIGKKDLYSRDAVKVAIGQGFKAVAETIMKVIVPSLSFGFLNKFKIIGNKEPFFKQIDVTDHPAFGKWTPLDQRTIGERLVQFIELRRKETPEKLRDNVWKGTDIIDDAGNCHGLSTLYLKYTAAGKEDKFYDILNVISKWDGNKKSLHSATLPSSLQRKYHYTNAKDLLGKFNSQSDWFADLRKIQENSKEASEIEEINQFLSMKFKNANELYHILARKYRDKKALKKSPFKNICEDIFEKYNNADDLFFQFCNDVSAIQTSTVASKEIDLFERQNIVQQLNFLKSDLREEMIKSLFDYPEQPLTEKQLEVYLQSFLQWPGTCIKIGGGNHATALNITPDGKFKYYDPNAKNKFNGNNIFSSAKELAKHIVEFKYKKLKKVNDNKISISFQGFKIYDSVKDFLEEVPSLSLRSNDSKAIHQAVMTRKIDLIRNISKDESINEKNAYGITPLMLAIQLKNSEMVNALLDHPQCMTNLKDTYGKFALLYAVSCHVENKILQTLIDKKADLETYSSEGQTALIAATIVGSVEHIDILLSAGASVITKDFSGKSALNYAIERFGDNSEIVARLKAKKDEQLLAQTEIEKNKQIELEKKEKADQLKSEKNRINIQSKTNVAKLLLTTGLSKLSERDDSGKNLIMKLFEITSNEIDEIEKNENEINFDKIYQKIEEYIDFIISKSNEDRLVELNIPDNDSKTTLMYIIENHKKIDEEILINLIKTTEKEHLNIADKHGNTVLHYALKSRANQDVLNELLIRQGLDIDKPNNDGITPLILLATYGTGAQVKALLVRKQFDVTQIKKAIQGVFNNMDNGLEVKPLLDQALKNATPPQTRVQPMVLSGRLLGGASSSSSPDPAGNEPDYINILKDIFTFVQQFHAGLVREKIDIPEEIEKLLNATLIPEEIDEKSGAEDSRIKLESFKKHFNEVFNDPLSDPFSDPFSDSLSDPLRRKNPKFEEFYNKVTKLLHPLEKPSEPFKSTLKKL